jgi:hypothetical protein
VNTSAEAEAKREYARQYRKANRSVLREKRIAWRLANPAEYKQRKRVQAKKYSALATENTRRWADLHPERTLLNYARARARKKGLAFNLTLEDVVIPTHCPVFGVPLTRQRGDKSWSPSLDRVDNTKGYVRGNVQVISCRANDLKRTATLDEMAALGVWAMKEKRKRRGIL